MSGKKRTSLTEFEIDTEGSIINEHNQDNHDEFVLALEGDDGSVEIDLGDGQDEDDVVVVVEGDTGDFEEDDKAAPVAPVVEDKKKESRAQERIRQLANKTKDAEARERAAAEERDQYKAHLESLSAMYLESEKASLTKQLETLKKDLGIAAADQDTEEYTRILTELPEVTSRLNEVNKHLADPSFNAEPSKEPAKAAATTYSPAAEDWLSGKEFIINNEDYAKLDASVRKKLYPVRKALASKAQELIQEGWDRTSPEFYEELDMRMSIDFDFYEALASDGVDALQSEGANKPAQPSSGETLTTTRSVEDKKKNVPVNSPSSSGSSTSSRKNSEKIKFSKEEISWWENHIRYSMGRDREITLKEYAQMVRDERRKEASNGK